MSQLDQVRAELAAFADDDDELAVEASGDFLIVRGGQDISGRIIDDGSGVLRVVVDDVEMSYVRFLTHRLAHLDVLAERILTKRAAPPLFVDGNALLSTPIEEPSELRASTALAQICADGSPFSTRVAFVTADAGLGKTVLLREVQHRTARAFLDGTSKYIFWHVDLQGRQLVRLSEALMGDLGDLRVSGLWMSAVIRLMRRRALVLAIDGFDELAAEQGSVDALGALATIVRQLDGSGVVIAASRRTFFDTEDYLARAGLITRTVAAACRFDQLSLLPWGHEEAVHLLDRVSGNSSSGSGEDLYGRTLTELGGDAQHPMLTRPFLLTRLARAMVDYGLEPAEFIRGMDDPHRGVAALVEAFVEREVKDKWVHRETGEPYLSVEQHMELLARVAEEMYEAQRDRLRLDVIETIASILFEQWGVEPDRRVQAVAAVKMHVLLTVPDDGDAAFRSFDHSEFRDYFIGFALRRHLMSAIQTGGTESLHSMLRVAQITDSTAKYVCAMLDLGDDRATILAARLAELCRDEKRMTFIPLNVGTLLPFVLAGRAIRETVVIDAPAVFSSLVFERTRLSNTRFEGCTFLNASLAGIEWNSVQLVRCVLGDLTIDPDSSVTNVVLSDCEVVGLRVVRGDEELEREFAPSRISKALADAGFTIQEQLSPLILPLEYAEDTPKVKVIRRLFRIFQRTTIVHEHGLRQRFGRDYNLVVEELIPHLEQHGILESRKWHGGGSANVWGLLVPLEDLLAAEEPGTVGALGDFWRKIKMS